MQKESAVRIRILNVASRLFYQQGYNATGINQVIAESEIARASLYKHFPAKADLLYAYTEIKNESWFSALEIFLADRKEPHERILGIFDFRIERQIEQSFGGCPFVKLSTELPIDEQKTFDLVKKHKAQLKLYIKNLVAEMQLPQNFLSADMLAEAIFMLMEGATVMVNIDKEIKSLLDAKKIVQKLLI